MTVTITSASPAVNLLAATPNLFCVYDRQQVADDRAIQFAVEIDGTETAPDAVWLGVVHFGGPRRFAIEAPAAAMAYLARYSPESLGRAFEAALISAQEDECDRVRRAYSRGFDGEGC